MKCVLCVPAVCDIVPVGDREAAFRLLAAGLDEMMLI
jgi:hypothetical protein